MIVTGDLSPIYLRTIGDRSVIGDAYTRMFENRTYGDRSEDSDFGEIGAVRFLGFDPNGANVRRIWDVSCPDERALEFGDLEPATFNL